jgi:hypothetical protein
MITMIPCSYAGEPSGLPETQLEPFETEESESESELEEDTD